jgi:uncharacterized membrane protein YGL010W
MSGFSGFFHRQLAVYADYHRDGRNCLMHIIGNPILALGIAWDAAIGVAIVVSTIPILFAAAAIASHVSVAWVWIITAALIVIGWAMQIVGHQCFEGRKPALLDNPVHMLMSPMYVFAKLYVALGLRPDLAPIVHGLPRYPGNRPADVGQHP